MFILSDSRGADAAELFLSWAMTPWISVEFIVAIFIIGVKGIAAGKRGFGIGIARVKVEK